MNTSHPLEHLFLLMIRPIVSISVAIVIASAAAPSSALPTAMRATVTRLPTASIVSLPSGGMNDYQPPNNGGPGKTGGSGTRWH